MGMAVLSLVAVVLAALHDAAQAQQPWLPERIAVLSIETFHNVHSGNKFDHYAQARFRTVGLRSQGLYAAKQG